MIRSFHHVALATRDLDRLCDFYIAHFGFAAGPAFGWQVGQGPVADLLMGLHGSGAEVRLLIRDDICLELFRFDAPLPSPPVAERGLWSRKAGNRRCRFHPPCPPSAVPA